MNVATRGHGSGSAATFPTAAPSYAAGETCQGRPATVVGTPNQSGLVGTEGPDVVVTNGAVSVHTLGGDDLVCVTDVTRPGVLTLRSGAGNDVVDASASGSSIDVELGTGSDHYTASAGRDYVVLGSNDGGPVDLDADTVVATTGGNASQSGDQYFSGMLDVPNPDVLDLSGDGHVVYWYGIQAAGSRVAVGTSAELRPTLGVGDVAIDAARGSWTEDGAPVLTWTGEVTRFELGPGAPRSLSFAGSDRDEYARVYLNRGARTVLRFALGGGDDTLLAPDGLGWRGSEYVGGPGEDSVDLWAGTRLDLDLARGRLEKRFFGTTQRSIFRGWDDVRVGAKTDDRPRHQEGRRPPLLRLHGHDPRAAPARTPSCPTAPATTATCSTATRGGRMSGSTVTAATTSLSGSRGKDLLVGGPGRDTIDGNANRDRCSGEKLRSCEIKLR